MPRAPFRSRSHRLNRIRKIVILLTFNIFMASVLLYGFEYYLALTDPFLNELPFDTNYYATNQQYYRLEEVQAYFGNQEMPEGRYTWGHLVINNGLGFRERDFAIPKPAGDCRIVVLGDSLTWGAGLAVKERYTNLVDTYLDRAFPNRSIEVLNFGLTGGPTVTERDILRSIKDRVDPDLVVVGFVLNDPQPKSQNYSAENERFNEMYGDLVEIIPSGLIKARAPRTARATLPYFLRWWHQGERAAAKIGFRHYNHENELLERVMPEEIPVNELDGHPSAKVNLGYAQKLFDTIESDINNGELCFDSTGK